MAETLLILYNPDNRDQAHWVFINEHGTPGNLNHGPLSELGQIARGHKATLLLDSSHINLTQVNIPSQNRKNQLLAIPFALEDALADDIEELHFAAGTRQSDNRIPVITINRGLLEDIIADFSHAGVVIDAVCADVLALPLNNNQWTLLLDNERALIKTVSFSGYYCDLDILPVFLQTLINQQHEKPEAFLVYASQQEPVILQQLGNIDIEIKPVISNESVITIFSSRSEERRVGKECRARWSPYHEKKKKKQQNWPEVRHIINQRYILIRV